jgi:integrase
MRLLLALGIYSGLRLGDCATLRWGEVDLHRRIIRRIPNKVARRNNMPILIPIHASLYAMLTAIPDANRKEYVLPATAATYIVRSDNVTDAVQAHFVACGISVHRPGTGKIKTPEGGKPVDTGRRAVVEVGFHSLRHSFVSLCREANAPLSVAESIVGHSTPAMTRHYTHTGEAAASKAVAALPDILGQTTAKPALPAPDPVADLKAQVRELVEKLTPQSLTTVRGELLALCR